MGRHTCLIRAQDPILTAAEQEQTMTATNTTARWMKSALTEAAKCETRMPWARGARRAETIARREERMIPRALAARAVRAS
jgi:hypothetical protein